jgi:peroxidase
MPRHIGMLEHMLAFFVVLASATAWAEDRMIDGSFNNKLFPDAGAAGRPMIRFGYGARFAGDGSGSEIFQYPTRENPRVISNTIFAQTTNVYSAANLSDIAWVWGQFLDHDIDLSLTDPAAGRADIPVPPGDILSPGPIPFTRSKYVLTSLASGGTRREQVNEVTSYIDASVVYGSDYARAAALRTDSGAGARLLTSAGNLRPLNTMGLENENVRHLPEDQLFAAGDIRSNENVALTSLQTVFLREHNRLVDRIEVLQPTLSPEQTYQLARKLVGAEIQIVTYKEFLPAIMGDYAPKAEDYVYDSTGPATITNAFAHAAYRFGHSMLSSSLLLADSSGPVGQLTLTESFANPNLLVSDPNKVDEILAGLLLQRAQEVDTLLVDDVRNALFGTPGQGGSDLAALNIQRGRDHGLPDYNTLRRAFEDVKVGTQTVGDDGFFSLGSITDFSQITSDEAKAQLLMALYGSVDNIDAWVGGLAEDRLPGASMGPLMAAIIGNQFTRLRDHDRLFYLSAALGLYTSDGLGGFILDQDIAAIVDLDRITLSQILEFNTGLTGLHADVFYVPEPACLAILIMGAGLILCGKHRRKR